MATGNGSALAAPVKKSVNVLVPSPTHVGTPAGLKPFNPIQNAFAFVLVPAVL